MRRTRAIAALILAAMPCCAMAQDLAATMNDVAERYVKLVLAVGVHDADYVDAYYGPPEWRTEAAAVARSLRQLDKEASLLTTKLDAVELPYGTEEIERERHYYLRSQLGSLRARVSMLRGKRFTFDEESVALYFDRAPQKKAEEFDAVLAQLERRLPGEGTMRERYEAFRSRFEIPKDRLNAVFMAAIDGCRARTLRHIALPPDESFTIEYVTNKSWSGYNWYQGNYRSLIQINTDLPIYIDRAIDLACHEGYPGHHVYNVLLEKNLVHDRGWPEYTVYPLFSPQSKIAEGTANYGIEVAFPASERRRFEREVLFPAAGLDARDVDVYYDVMTLVDQLSHAGNEAARRYRDGEIDAAAAAKWLETYALYSPERAAQRVRFIDQYGAYVINYNVGKDFIAEQVARFARSPEERWEQFARWISSPKLAPDPLEE